jgi:hypothetical protein
MEQSPMNMGDGDSFPCGNEKPDICKSVRDSMLSVKPSVLGIDSLDKTVFSLPISFCKANCVWSRAFSSGDRN